MNDIKTNKMLVNVVLDRSGSMGSTREGTVSGYNEYINGLRGDTASEYSVSLIQFDAHGAAHGPELTISYIDKPLADVPELKLADYEPRGGTPLYDAIGECTRRVEDKGRAVTCVIITDGEENASKEFNKDSIKALIKSKEDAGWTFVFLGADIDAYSSGSQIGISAMNTMKYTKGMEANLYAAAAGSTMMRSHNVATVGLSSAMKVAFFDDVQRSSVGDDTVQQSTSGGGSPATGSFHRAQPPIDTSLTPKVDGKKRRDWSTNTK